MFVPVILLGTVKPKAIVLQVMQIGAEIQRKVFVHKSHAVFVTVQIPLIVSRFLLARILA